MNKKVTLRQLLDRKAVELYAARIYSTKHKKLINSWKIFKQAIDDDKRTISTTKTK